VTGTRPEPDGIRVVFAADDSYVIPLAASVRSVLDNAVGSRTHVAVLSCGISAGTRELLLSSWPNGSVEFIDVRPRLLTGLPTSSHVISHPSVATYARLLLSDLLPDNWQRIIYIDADTITLGPLDELWNHELGRYALGAVGDRDVTVISSVWGVQCWRAMDLDPHAPYFNAGLMLINLETWREQQIGQRALRYVQRYASRVVMFDQEGLNAAVNGAYSKLSGEWNVMQPAQPYQSPDNCATARIRHFIGPAKPWSGCDYEDSGKEAFFRYLDRTRWRGWRPGASPARAGSSCKSAESARPN
jgi:lipopolysaccharide biosynthesis glycosyltransferase